MMKKVYIIGLILTLLLRNFVSADLEENIVHAWTFEDDPDSADLLDQFGSLDSSSDSVRGRVAGINNFGWDCESGSTDNIVMDGSGNMPVGNTNRTISIWAKAESSGSGMNAFSYGTAAGQQMFGLHFGAALGLTLQDSGANNFNHNFVAGDWYNLVMVYNETPDLLYLYVNGNKTAQASTTLNTNTDFFRMCVQNNINDAPFDGIIDEFTVWNDTKTGDEIVVLWNGGTGTFFPFAGIESTATPIITSPSPEDNSKNNTNVTLNVTHSTTQNDVRYYLYFGNTTTLTEGHLYLDNVTRDGSEYKSFLTNVSDGKYIWKWRVQNITNGIFSANTTQRTLTIDTTNPIIILNPSNSFNTSNVATISQYANYLFFNITFTDETNLFGVLINVTKDGVSYFNFTNTSFGTVGNQTFNYTANVSTGDWLSGVYNINISVSDSHTANSIGDYKPKNGIREIEFDTIEGNNIKISSDGSAYSTLWNKKEDRYEFGWNYLLTDSTRKFTIEADSKIYYFPDSNYIGHFVVGNVKGANWIDFEGIGEDYSVKKISDTKYEITFTNLPLTNQITSNSLGGANRVTETYKWYKGNYTTIAPTVSTFGNIETFSLNITRNLTYAIPNATLNFNGTLYNLTLTTFTDYLILSRDITISKPVGASQNIPYFWNITITQPINNNKYSFKISNTINVSESLLDNCSSYNDTILVIRGKDEETDIDVNITLNIVFFPENGVNNSYELSGSINYTFCSDSDTNYTLDSIMEYGDGTIYTNKKYYLNDFQINTLTTAEVFLYHLNNSKASEIVLTVFDTTTGDRVEKAFIKILRYYPGENVFRIVEIAQTDEVGQSLGKIVLADVFYKFIIEAPAGTVKLDTGVLRVLSLTRSFGISFTTDVLDTWDKIHGVSNSVTCTKETQTCRFTWSDESNIVQDATLEVWRTSGFRDTLLSSQTTTAAAGTISYTIVEDTLGNAYTAKGFIESNTGTSNYGIGIASLIYPDNPFFNDENQRLASIFPLFLFAVVMIFVLIDFGVIGIVVGALLSLVVGAITSILPLSPFFLISFILMAAILIYKLSK